MKKNIDKNILYIEQEHTTYLQPFKMFLQLEIVGFHKNNILI